MKPLLMGIVNCTPDSFSDGGAYNTPSSAVDHALRLVDDGADIIDVGGESTRPGAQSVGAAQEMHRVIPVIEGIRKHNTSIPISIDTSKAEVAVMALNAGATMINDVSAGTNDEQMFTAVIRHNVPIILMHMRGSPRTMQDNPQYANVVLEVKKYLSERVNALRTQSVSTDQPYTQHIYIDPGIGFGKTVSHSLTLLRSLEQLSDVAPIALGISRKSFLGKISGLENPADRDGLTAAFHAFLLDKPIAIARVHNVRLAARVLAL